MSKKRKQVVINKRSKINGLLTIKEIDRDIAKCVLVKHHYSHSWNSSFGKINIGIFKDNKLKGVASFGNLMNPKSYKKISDDITQDEIVELNRLWISDELGMNSESILISSSFKIIKANYPHIKLIQSFADGRLGCGTIYKATNFKYFGYTESVFYELLDDENTTYHKVPMENTSRPNRMIKLNHLYIQGKLKPFKVKTYRYIYPLDRRIKFNLKELPYPEYEKGKLYIDDYKHQPRLIFRSWILSEIYGYDIANDFFNYISNTYSKDTIVKDGSISLDNKTINKIASKENKLSVLSDCKNRLNGLVKGLM